MPHLSLSSKKGFSLAELIIYLGILGISAGVFGGILNSISSTQVSEFNQNEVSGQLNFAVQTMQRLIRESSAIDIGSGVATGTLILQMPVTAQNPTTIYTQNHRLYFTQGTSTPQAITNERVSVDSVEFRRFARTGAKDVVQIDLAVSQTQPTGERIAQSLRSAVTRVNAAAFDGDILPNADGSYNIGSVDTRWKDAWFSGQVHAGQFCIGSSDCISSWAGAGVTGTGSTNYIAKWSGASTIAASSLLYDNGTSVGISNINPGASYKLDVNGSVNSTGLCLAGDCKTAWSQVGTPSQWTTSGTSIYYNTGNVGIGTASPAKKLEIVASAGNAQLRLTNSTVSKSWDFYSFSDNNFYINNSAGTKFTILDNGNVGIGTATPAEKLEVNGNIKLSGGTPTYKLTNVATPTANNDVATKAYVDAASGGSSGIKYWALQPTSASYTGNLGGYTGANAKCVAEFGTGAVMLNSSIITSAYSGGIPIVPNYSTTPSYWWWSPLPIQNDTTTNAKRPYQWSFATGSANTPTASCGGWTRGYSGEYGAVIDSSGSWYGYWQCDSSTKILCAVPN